MSAPSIHQWANSCSSYTCVRLPARHRDGHRCQAQPSANRNFAKAISRGRDLFGLVEEEDPDEWHVAEEAFRKAYSDTQPPSLRIEGMQEWAGAVWDRRKHIPFTTQDSDPLHRLFTEFDHDHDGLLTADDVQQAMASHQIFMSVEQSAWFIKASESASDHTVGLEEFPALVFHMAAADLAAQDMASEEWSAQVPEQPSMDSSSSDDDGSLSSHEAFCDRETNLASAMAELLSLSGAERSMRGSHDESTKLPQPVQQCKEDIVQQSETD